MVDVLNIESEYLEWLESELQADLFKDMLVYGSKTPGKLLKKRYMTLGIYCPLVASIRNPRQALRKCSKPNQIPEQYEDKRQFIASCCQYMLAVCEKNHGNSISFYSTVDNECLLKDFKINGNNIVVSSLAITFHPFMNTEYRKSMNIDPKQLDANIYALYVLYTESGKTILKKYLVCDTLKDTLLIQEQYQMDSGRMIYSPYDDDPVSLSVCGREQYGIELVLIRTNQYLTFCTPHGIIYCLYVGYVPNNMNSIPKENLGLQNYLDNNNQCNLHATYLLNFTKALNMRGFSLLEPNKFSHYSVFQLQVGGQVEDHKIESHYIYLLVAKKKHEDKYSFIWKLCPEYTITLDLSRWGCDILNSRDFVLRPTYINQGRDVIVESSHYSINEEGQRDYDFLERHWERHISRYSHYYDFETTKTEHSIREAQFYY